MVNEISNLVLLPHTMNLEPIRVKLSIRGKVEQYKKGAKQSGLPKGQDETRPEAAKGRQGNRRLSKYLGLWEAGVTFVSRRKHTQ